MKLFNILLILAGILLQSFSGDDIQSDIYNGLKSGNSKFLSKHFASTLSVSINRDESVYAKFQAETVLADFFRTNKTLALSSVQRLTRNTGNKYLIYNLKTAKKTYRVFVKLIDNKGDFTISELRIE